MIKSDQANAHLQYTDPKPFSCDPFSKPKRLRQIGMENPTKAIRIQMVIGQPDLLVMSRIHQMKIQWICSRIMKMKTEGKMVVSRQQPRNHPGQPLSPIVKLHLKISRNE